MLSRVAESIYWMNRYIERAENYARFISVNLNLAPDLPAGIPEQWQPLVMTTGDTKPFKKKYGTYSRENVTNFLAFDRDNSSSILSCLIRARENARSVREVISSEMWNQINRLYLWLRESAGVDDREGMAELLESVKQGCHAYSGIMDATYSHSEGWHFGNMGRYIERADKTSRIIDVKYYIMLPSPGHVGMPLDLLQWGALLKSASAFEMYRKLHGNLEASSIVNFLVFDREFPRAIQFCLKEAEKSLHAISGKELADFSNLAEKELGKLRSELEFTDIQDILSFGLHEYLDELQSALMRVDQGIYESFFTIARKKKSLKFPMDLWNRLRKKSPAL